MNVIRKLGLAAVGALIIAAAFIPSAAVAGTADQPEIADLAGDSVSNIKSMDLLAAWFHDETNTTFQINMSVGALESYTPRQDISNLPVTEYEAYFSVGDSNYAVACKVPVHGPLYVTIQFDIRSVTYSNNTTQENSLSTLSNCKYDVTNHMLLWTVSKISIGNATAGTHLTKTWAAVYNKNRGDSQRKMEDRGPNSGYGRDFILTGTSGGFITDVELSADSLTQECRPGTPATFRISVFNNGTSQVTVAMINSTPDKGWSVDISTANLTLAANRTVIVTVYIYCPRDAKNGTTESISVHGLVYYGTNSSQTATTKNSLYLTASVNYIPPKAAEDTMLVKLGKFFTKPTMLTYVIYVLIVLAVVAGVVGTAMRSRSQRRKERMAALPPAPSAVK